MIPEPLKSNPLFSTLGSEEQERLFGYFTQKKFSKNGTIFVEKMTGESMYFINSGKIILTRMVSEGVEKNLAELSSGESFGELALIDSGPRAVTARALEDTDIYLLSQEGFHRLLAEDPSLGIKFVLNLFRRVVLELREAVSLISEGLSRR